MGHLAFRTEMKDVDAGKQVASNSLLRCLSACVGRKQKIYVDKPPKSVRRLVLLEVVCCFLSCHRPICGKMEGMLREMDGNKSF